jgi:class 3 adenylate cyclase
MWLGARDCAQSAPNSATDSFVHGGTRLELILEGSSPLARFFLDGSAPALIGRSSQCQVRLPEGVRYISRVHARLAYDEGAWRLADLSAHGTTINGQRVPKDELVLLAEGDTLGFGSCALTVRLLGPHDDSMGEDGSYSFSMENVRALEGLSEVGVDTTKLLRSALELPDKLIACVTETEILEAACTYVVEALSPNIATAYMAGTPLASEDIQVLAQARRASKVAIAQDVFEPVVSRRVSDRLREAPDAVLFVQRSVPDATLSATVAISTHTLGACLVEADPMGRPTVLYAVGDRPFAHGQRWAAQYLRLVATLVQQHLTARRRGRLTKYFSPKVVSLLMAQGGTSQLEQEPKVATATSMFFDVRGSSLPLEASAEEILSVYADLREIINRVTDCIFDADGTVIDYAGDGVFATWGVPFPQPTQATLAVRCALALFDRLPAGDFPRFGRGGPSFGIGIAKGQVLAGGMGSRGMFKYGILGPPVSAAQRIEELTKRDKLDHPILVTSDVRADLDDAEFACESLGTVVLRGAGSEVEVFAVARRGVASPAFSRAQADTDPPSAPEQAP